MSTTQSRLMLLAAIGLSVDARAGHTEVASHALTASTQPGNGSTFGWPSADGRYIAFTSSAPNLVPDDSNGREDAFVFDRQTQSISRVSVDSAGAQANLGGSAEAISADGRFVVFSSVSNNLVPGQVGFLRDVFLHDRQTGATTLVSLADDESHANGNNAGGAAISDDGRYIVFASHASNLVAGDSNLAQDVFVRDRQLGSTTRVSVDSSGNQSSSYSYAPAVSGDGRHVAFASLADNLVVGDGNGSWDVFVHDRQSGATTRESVGAGGIEADGVSLEPDISDDGRFVAFSSSATNLVVGDSNGTDDVFVRDRQGGATTRVSRASDGTQGDQYSLYPSLSTDGRFVAFWSTADNLVTGDSNGFDDTFVHDRQAGITTRVSVSGAGAQGNAESELPRISGDGRFVVFDSLATQLVAGDRNGGRDVFVHDRQLSATERVPDIAVPPPAGAPWLGDGVSWTRTRSLSADGRYLAFVSHATNLVAGDSNGHNDIFVRDLRAGITTRVSIDSSGAEANGFSDSPSISADGRYVAFQSNASNLVSGDSNGVTDVFRHDRQTGATIRLSVNDAGVQGNGNSLVPAISAQGDRIAFISLATNLVAGDGNGRQDVFVRDVALATTTRVSVYGAGAEANGHSYAPAISGDGRRIAFASFASNLVVGDGNGKRDVFVHDLDDGSTRRVSVDSAGVEADAGSDTRVALSGDGRRVAFQSDAGNLVAGDGNAITDVFVHDLDAATTRRVSVNSAGQGGTSASIAPTISADGRLVGFVSGAGNLVSPAPGTSADHVFGHDLLTGRTDLWSSNNAGIAANADSASPALSADGHFVAYGSDASNLVDDGDYNGLRDVFVRNLILFADGFENSD